MDKEMEIELEIDDKVKAKVPYSIIQECMKTATRIAGTMEIDENGISNGEGVVINYKIAERHIGGFNFSLDITAFNSKKFKVEFAEDDINK